MTETDATISGALMLDGLQIQAEHRSESHLLGRSVLVGDLAPLRSGGKTGTAGALQEAADAGWHLNTLTGQLEWLSLELGARQASASNREHIQGRDGETFHFGTDPGVLRTPWPIDLFHADPGSAHQGYVGPRGARIWLNALHAQASDVQASFPIGDASYARETIASMQNRGQFSLEGLVDDPPLSGMATIGPTMLTVSLNLRHNTARGESVGGSRQVRFLVPLRSVCSVRFTGRWSTVRPWRGADKPIVEERGYSPIDKSSLTVSFSDGWRVCKLMIRYDRYDHRQVGEAAVLDLARSLIDATNRVQGIEAGPVELPKPDPTLEPEEVRVERELVAEFGNAVHFGVALPLSMVEGAPGAGQAPPPPPPPPGAAPGPSAAPPPQAAPPPSSGAASGPAGPPPTEPEPLSSSAGAPSPSPAPPSPMPEAGGWAPPGGPGDSTVNQDWVADGVRSPERIPPPPTGPVEREEAGLAQEVAAATALGGIGCLIWLAPLAALAAVGWLLAAAGQEAMGLGVWMFIPAVFLLRGRLEAVTGHYRGSRVAGRNQDGIQQFTGFMESARNVFWLLVGLGFALIGVVLLIAGLTGSL